MMDTDAFMRSSATMSIPWYDQSYRIGDFTYAHFLIAFCTTVM